MDIDRLLKAVVQHGGSDLHLQVDSPPTIRLHNLLNPLKSNPLTAEDVAEVVRHIASEPTRAALERDRSVDLAYVSSEGLRFRVNIYYERNRLCVAFRPIPAEIPKFESLNLPAVILDIAKAQRGLVLVTGTTGSGKSTTLAAMLGYINENRRDRIITIEDPIEFIHTSKKSLIAQREVGTDTPSFFEGLRRALRQDPDVILIGELRDRETMQTALQAADTGHMVYSTVHTTTAPVTVQRLIVMFPPDERELLLMQLATNLEAVISQRLARTADGKGRIPVVEVLRNTPVVRKLIAEDRCNALSQVMASREQGMQTFDQHLTELYTQEKISGTEALRLATNPEAVSLGMRGITSRDTRGGVIG